MAGRLLAAAGVDPADVQATLAELSVATTPVPSVPDSATDALLSAWRAADERGHAFIGTEHLLLGLVEHPSPAGTMLADRSLEQHAIRAGIDLLGETATSHDPGIVCTISLHVAYILPCNPVRHKIHSQQPKGTTYTPCRKHWNP
ncbi:MAG: hypothetical protein NVS2B7_34810 [Herpetosiphon sp.]